MLNTRPLIYVGADVETGILLTPTHFLSLNPKIAIPEMDFEESDYIPVSSNEKLIEIWKKGQRHLNVFWKIWKEDYLRSLRERMQSKLKVKGKPSQETAKVGDIVLIKEENQPRNTWKIVKIIELIKGSDGEIRSTKVRVTHGGIRTRSLTFLSPLECSAISSPDESEYSSSAKAIWTPKLKKVKLRRKIRSSATDATTKIRSMIRAEDEDDDM